MKRFTIASLSLVALALAACSFGATTDTDTQSDASSSSVFSVSSAPVAMTYDGVLRAAQSPIDAAPYKLTLANGSVVWLRSDKENLESYIGYRVQATGTVEVSAYNEAVMNVTALMSFELVDGSSSSSEESSTMSGSSLSSSSMTSSVSSAPSSVQVSSASSKKSSSSKAASSVASSSAASVSAYAPEMQARIAKMAKAKGDDAWSQQYCSSHIGACFPVRGDYWYHSFGATSTALWHVELNSEEIVNLGDGPISVNLLTGTVNESNDGLVADVGDGTVVGYKSWTNNRHFEVRAPAELKSAVERIVANIVPYQPQGSSSSL